MSEDAANDVMGAWRIKTYAHGAGYVAEVVVRLRVAGTPASSCPLDFAGCAWSGLEDSERWRAAVSFGAHYAMEQMAQAPGVTRITVVKVGGFPVDTVTQVVALASAQAVWSALGARPQREPEVDFERTGLFWPR